MVQVRLDAPALVDTFCDALWLEDGLAKNTLEAYRRDLKLFANWLANHGRAVQDPRLAWIQLDYCLAISRENPAEAKKIFAAVKDRTPSSSPVYPRIQELAKSYE